MYFLIIIFVPFDDYLSELGTRVEGNVSVFHFITDYLDRKPPSVFIACAGQGNFRVYCVIEVQVKTML